jgi:hypothetical protein
MSEKMSFIRGIMQEELKVRAPASFSPAPLSLASFLYVAAILLAALSLAALFDAWREQTGNVHIPYLSS